MKCTPSGGAHTLGGTQLNISSLPYFLNTYDTLRRMPRTRLTESTLLCLHTHKGLRLVRTNPNTETQLPLISHPRCFFYLLRLFRTSSTPLSRPALRSRYSITVRELPGLNRTCSMPYRSPQRSFWLRTYGCGYEGGGEEVRVWAEREKDGYVCCIPHIRESALDRWEGES